MWLLEPRRAQLRGRESTSTAAMASTWVATAVSPAPAASSAPTPSRTSSAREFNPDSLNNEFGKYGSRFSQESWTNPYATKPPAVIQKEESRYDFGYKGDLTENDYNPHSLRYWDRDLDDSIKEELTDPDPNDWD